MPTPPPAQPGPPLGYVNMMAPYTPSAYSPPPSLPYAPMHVPGSFSTSSQPTWNQVAFIASMKNITLNYNEGTYWILDSGASSHMSSNMNFLSAYFPSPYSSITIGDGSTILVHCIGHSSIPSSSSLFLLFNILVVPSLIKSLISVCQFTMDNQVILDFDPFGYL
jgi:hypothetical protein